MLLKRGLLWIVPDVSFHMFRHMSQSYGHYEPHEPWQNPPRP